jgi:hypothetical protein
LRVELQHLVRASVPSVLALAFFSFMSPTPASSQKSSRIWARSKLLANKPDQKQEITVDAFQVVGTPLLISNASLTSSQQGYELKFSGSNTSNEQLLGVRYILLFVDSAGTVRSVFEQSEKLKLAAYSSALVRFRAPLGFTIDREDRAFLLAGEVIGEESIWETAKGKDALQHYAKGESFAIPDVRRSPNLVDAPASGMRIIP